jgi:glycosyltransferase involved in cell wall biosynthesis
MTLRAVHIVPSIQHEASGPSYAVPSLCRALVAEGVDVSVHVLARGVPAVWDGLSIHEHPEWRGVFTRLGVSPSLWRALVREAEAGASIVHNHSLWMMPNVYPGFAVARTKSRLVTSPHGTLDLWARRRSRWKKRIMMALLQRRTLDRTDCFFATSAAEHESVRSAGLRAPVAVIPIGIDLPALGSRVRATPRRLVFLGRLHPKKGLDVLLRAWSVASRQFPGWELYIYGPDESGYATEMKELNATLGNRRVFFRGPVYGAEKWRELAAASLFVLPTHAENFGIAVAEALACRVAAIVTHGAPWPGLEVEGCGWWIDQGIGPLTACLEVALAQSDEQLDAMGARGRQWIERDFSWSRIGEMTARTYSWLVEGGAMPHWVRLD